MTPPTALNQTGAPASAGRRIPLSEPTLEPSAWTYVKDALDSGWVSSLGPYVDEFERRMAERFGVPRTVATVNGTAALHIALLLAGVQPGDEIIVPSMTFIATINAIRYAGAVPVFWDSKPDHWNADPALLEALITPKTRAIMVVHLYGTPAEMDTIMAIAKKHSLKVIEDAAEALGAFWQGQPCGSIGDIGCLSFNGNKVMTTGSGGLIISKDAALMQRAHYLINQAKDDALSFQHDEVGYNYRLTNLQAALGVSQLEGLPSFLAKKAAIAERYQQAFSNHPSLITFELPKGAIGSWWLYGIAINPKRHPDKTSLDLVHALDALNIQSRPFFKPGHEQKPFLPFVLQDQGSENKPLPHASQWHRFGFNLPSSVSLTDEEQETVIQAVLSTLESWG
jgi:perosamine synthetase